MTEGFARRWARLKSGERRPAVAPPEEPPPLESLALDEIAPWLRRNVPELWKRAALRRLWVSDPAIRDFVGPADYAWDWNTPGGAPGYGPLRAIDDLARLLDRAIGAPEPPKPPDPAEPASPVAQASPTPSPASDDPPVPVRIAGPAPLPPRRRGGRAAPV